MRLLESVLSGLKNISPAQRRFVGHLLELLLMLPGRATWRNLSRYSPYHEKTFSRWFAQDIDWVQVNQTAILQGVPAQHEQVLAFDPSFVPKSGKHTYGLARFWNGTHSRAEKGLEIGVLAWVDVTTIPPMRSVWNKHLQPHPPPQSTAVSTPMCSTSPA